MKEFVSITVGLLIFFGCFWLAAMGISAIAGTIDDNSTRQVIRIVLWLVCFGLITWISVILGLVIGVFIYEFLENKE